MINYKKRKNFHLERLGFDPYRQQDFERKKAAGFPPPLYKSTFPTPEATPQQQAEREKYWRDIDHYGESFSKWY